MCMLMDVSCKGFEREIKKYSRQFLSYSMQPTRYFALFVCILCLEFLKYVCLLTRVSVCIKLIWFCIHYLVFTEKKGEKAQ